MVEVTSFQVNSFFVSACCTHVHARMASHSYLLMIEHLGILGGVVCANDTLSYGTWEGKGERIVCHQL